MKKLVLPGLLFAVALAFLFVEATVSGQTRKNRPRRVAATVAQPVVRAPQLAAPPQQATPTPSPTPSPSPSPGASPSPTQSPTPPSPAGTPPPASTADEAAIDEDEIVRVNSNLVVVPVAVTDARGEAVQGLQAADFRLEEESRAQEVAQLGDAEQVPLDIALMIDVSSSVSERFQFEQQAAARFLKQVLKPADRAAIFAIRQEGGLEQGLTSAEIASIKLTAIPAASGPTP
ncbi:MAG: hypothetical protein H0T45_11235, partial [Pyrinomonadaceae bacterium]|nr:hypothetical protein [Pyrinomonadaceae bacterium]